MVAELDHVAAALDALRLVVFFHPDPQRIRLPVGLVHSHPAGRNTCGPAAVAVVGPRLRQIQLPVDQSRRRQTFSDALMSAEADAVCGAEYGQRGEDRVNSRNGCRSREWDTRAGTVELAIPKLRSGSCFPDWLLQRRRRAEPPHHDK